MNIPNMHNKVACLDVNIWAVLDTLPEYIAVVDGTGTILYLNATWYQLLMQRAVGAEGFNVGSNFITSFANAFGSDYSEDIRIIQQGLDNVINGTQDQFTHDYAHYQSGTKCWYTINIIPTHIMNGTRGVIIQQKDSTQTKQQTEALYKQTIVFQALSSAAEQFLHTGHLQPTLHTMLQHLGQFMDMNTAFVCADSNIPECIDIWTKPHTTPMAPQHNGHTTVPTEYANIPCWRDKLSRGEPVYETINTLLEEERHVLTIRNTLSVALIPIVVNQQWWGYIGLEDTHKHHVWTEAEHDILQRAANIIASALTNQSLALGRDVQTL